MKIELTAEEAKEFLRSRENPHIPEDYKGRVEHPKYPPVCCGHSGVHPDGVPMIPMHAAELIDERYEFLRSHKGTAYTCAACGNVVFIERE